MPTAGLKYFVTLTEKNAGSAIGLEYQVLDYTLHPDAKLGRDGNRSMFSSNTIFIKADKQKRFIHQPEVNEEYGRVVVYPNQSCGALPEWRKSAEYDRGSTAFRDLVALSKYKKWKDFGEAPKGHILIQDYGNEVSFRSY